MLSCVKYLDPDWRRTVWRDGIVDNHSLEGLAMRKHGMYVVRDANRGNTVEVDKSDIQPVTPEEFAASRAWYKAANIKASNRAYSSFEEYGHVYWGLLIALQECDEPHRKAWYRIYRTSRYQLRIMWIGLCDDMWIPDGWGLTVKVRQKYILPLLRKHDIHNITYDPVPTSDVVLC